MSERVAQLPETLLRNAALDRWLAIQIDGRVVVRTGKVELGQGIRTALTLIAADELDVHPDRIDLHTADTAHAPNEFVTAGSMSVEIGGAALRQAMAQARAALIEMAARQLGVDSAQLRVDDGLISGGGANRSLSYAELQGGRPFGLRMTEPVVEKSPSEYRWVGKGMARVDLAAKLRGGAAFVHDLGSADDDTALLHARVLRPPTPAHRLMHADTQTLARLAGVHGFLVDGSFVAICGEREADVMRCYDSAQRCLHWQRSPDVAPLATDIDAHLRNNECAALLVVDGTPTDDPIPAVLTDVDSQRVLRARYSRPFIMHGSIAPSAARARYADGRLHVHCASQGVELLKVAIAQVLGMPAARVRIQHVEGAGCYGHNGADDVALDAALVARGFPGRTVLLKWTRVDEHRFEPYGPAMRIDIVARVDVDAHTGEQHVDYWSQDVWSYTHSGRPGLTPSRPGAPVTSSLLAAWHLARPFAAPAVQPGRAPHGGVHRNADPLYRFARRRIVKRLAAPSPLRTSSLRGLGAHANVFAIESAMDELAARVGAAPVDFRLRHLDPSQPGNARARAVLEALRSWTAENAQPVPRTGTAIGRGIGFAQYKNRQCYAAVCVELEVDEATAAIQLLRAWIVADAGRVVDPDGLINQLEGGLVQSASWTLLEAVRYDADGVTSNDWESYPILRFRAVPQVQTRLLQPPGAPSLGAGEATQGPTAAAIANAVFAATGLRVRDLPLTPDRLREAAHA